MQEYGIPCIKNIEHLEGQKFDGVVLTVAHNEFLTVDLRDYVNDTGLVYDVKGIITNSDYRL
jgi:UDP-N-acetyl-D-galactosamine dehydrogenase